MTTVSGKIFTILSVENLRKASNAAYLACEKDVADDISNLFRWAANEIDRLAVKPSDEGVREAHGPAQQTPEPPGVQEALGLVISAIGKIEPDKFEDDMTLSSLLDTEKRCRHILRSEYLAEWVRCHTVSTTGEPKR
jgi:hypothetical protein